MKNILVILLLTGCVVAQNARIESPTRQVTQFGQWEQQLATGVQHKNRAALDPLLADDFALRTARSGGQIIGRAEWLQHATTDYNVRDSYMQGLDVRQYGDLAIVSFLYHQAADSAGHGLSGDFFIVDVWRKTAAGWKLATRYSAGPGIGFVVSPKPTGKD